MTSLRFTLMLLLFLQITACAGRYHPDITDPKQSARLRVASVGKAWAYQLKDQCIPQTDVSLNSKNSLLSALTKNKHQSIGMPTTGLPEGASFEEVTIPSGVPINVVFVRSSIVVLPTKTYSDSCVIGVRFTPEAGSDYQLLNSLSKEQCAISTDRIRQNDKGLTTLELIPKIEKLPPC